MDRENGHLKRKEPEGECSNAQGIDDPTSLLTTNNVTNPQSIPVQQTDASSPELSEDGSSDSESFATVVAQFDEFLANYTNQMNEEGPEIGYDSGDWDLPEFDFDTLGEEVDMHDLWRLDIDDMSHEELVDLEEQMGIIGTGVSEHTICEHLRRYIDYRPTTSGPETDDALCCICLEGIHNEQLIGILDCNHEFHYYCVKEWLLRNNSCPLCRATGLTPPN